MFYFSRETNLYHTCRGPYIFTDMGEGQQINVDADIDVDEEDMNRGSILANEATIRLYKGRRRTIILKGP